MKQFGATSSVLIGYKPDLLEFKDLEHQSTISVVFTNLCERVSIQSHLIHPSSTNIGSLPLAAGYQGRDWRVKSGVWVVEDSIQLYKLACLKCFSTNIISRENNDLTFVLEDFMVYKAPSLALILS